MTPEREAEIQARCERATPGPWDTEEWQRPVRKEPGQTLVDWRVTSLAYSDEEPGVCGGHSKNWPLIEPDADFIAHARQDVPDLLGALARARAAQDALVVAVRGLAANITDDMLETLRSEWGNTNVACIKHWQEQARAALKLAEESTPR